MSIFSFDHISLKEISSDRQQQAFLLKMRKLVKLCALTNGQRKSIFMYANQIFQG